MLNKDKLNTKKDYTFSTNKLLVLVNIFLVVLVVVLVVMFRTSLNKKSISTITHNNNNSYTFTNPILDCEFDTQSSGSIIFSNSLVKKVTKIKSQYSLNHVSLYYRDLNNGPWVGINEKEVFSPASLLKVPIFMAFLYQAQSEPSILNKKITISPLDISSMVHQNIVYENMLILGEEYTLSKIAENMIKKSDNTATMSILRNINLNNIGDVFKSVGVPYKDINTEVPVRVKDYAGFFRVLFNSSYLDRDMSEKALEILTKSEYKNGIVAGVPSDVVVAHKFGERNIENSKEEKQLHDCGIVYYPGKPYILCIMTRGNNFITQEKAIQDLSKYVYTEVKDNS